MRPNAYEDGTRVMLGETTTPGQDVTEILGLRLWHRGKWHLCCWAWKLALIIPLIHLILHFCGVPHPEGIGFIP